MTTGRIQTLRTQAPEIGRLRGGQKNDKNKPERLDTWRATSKHEQTLRALASIYGGEVVPWTDRPGEFEVVTETNVMEILLPTSALFTAYEMWGSGGNKRRCDGERCTIPVEGPDGGRLEQVDCICEAEGQVPGESKSACTVTLRLKVVLPQIPGMGIWMVTSGSIYAAMELPAQVDFIEAAVGLGRNILIPCDLTLDHRTEKKAWEKFTREYNVPSLTIAKSMTQLQRQIEGSPGQRPTVALSQTPAIASASGAPSAAEVGRGAGTTGVAVGTNTSERAEPVATTQDITAEALRPAGKGWTFEELAGIAEDHGYDLDGGETLTSLYRSLHADGIVV